MVERLSPRKIVIVDLDGTLVDGNTLHLYLKSALLTAPFGIRARIAGLLVLRRLRIISHVAMKFGALRRIKPTDRLNDRFVKNVKRKMRSNVTRLLEDYRQEGCTVLLATAAPDIYIPLIWTEEFLATKTDGNEQKDEMRGETKAAAVSNFMHRGDTIHAVITDHHDDLPLLRLEAQSRFLVSPSRRTVALANAEGIKYTILGATTK